MNKIVYGIAAMLLCGSMLQAAPAKKSPVKPLPPVKMNGKAFQQMIVINDQPPRTAPPCRDRALADGFVFIRNDFFRVHDRFRTDTVADRTRSVRTVERKIPRLQSGK